MGRRFSLLISASLVILLCASTPTVSACDCHTAHTISMGVPSFGGFAMAQPMAAANYQPFQLNLVPSPPGTVGQTYSRPSHPVPSDEHPRTAMLAVRDNGQVPFLTVQNMGGIRMKSGIWLFESKRPLDPGACQIVRVEARQTAMDIEPYDTKFVRLIAGRIVYLDF